MIRCPRCGCRRNPARKTKAELMSWLEEAIPIIVFQYILMSKAVKVCTTIAPAFSVLARHVGFDAYVVQTTGHAFNVVMTSDAFVEIDLSALQFELCKFVKEEDLVEGSPYGSRKAIKRALAYIAEDPWRAVKIGIYSGRVDDLIDPSINPEALQYVIESYYTIKEDLKAIKEGDLEALEVYDDVPYIEEYTVKWMKDDKD